MPVVDWVAQRKFEAAIRCLDKVDNGPKFQGIVDLFSGDPYCTAYRVTGLSSTRILRRLAQAGHQKAIRELVLQACDAVEVLESMAESQPELLREFATRRANWPVMICRHETSSKPVSAYLEKIQLGVNCLINADGLRVAKYSLRTPINRYVWNTLKSLRYSIAMLADKPPIAAIDLDSLPKLTKATAKIWADRALMPYISFSHEDFREEPDFRAILARPGVKTRGQQRREIRKDVIRALQSLAAAA